MIRDLENGAKLIKLSKTPRKQKDLQYILLGKEEYSDYTKLLGVWKQMKGRCNNPKNKDYSHYGYRGIKVGKDFETFIDFYMWAIENGFKQGLTLERKNNNGNYTSKNCCFITRKEQVKNRNSYVIKVNDNKINVLDYCYKLGLPSNVAILMLKTYKGINIAK